MRHCFCEAVAHTTSDCHDGKRIVSKQRNLCQGDRRVPAEDSRRRFLQRCAAYSAGVAFGGNLRASAAAAPAAQDGDKSPDYRIELTTARRGFDRRTDQRCWAQARAGIIPPAPGDPDGMPTALITTQPLLLSGSDVYYAVHQMVSKDLGQTWTDPQVCPTLERRKPRTDVDVALCDFTPMWHAASGRLLGTGHTAWYLNNRLMPKRPRETGYSVYDASTSAWSAWKTLQMPQRPEFNSAGAGSTQRVDLPDGQILLPIYFKRPDDRCYSATVVRCRFDGSTLQYVEHGDELKHDVPRGFCEPSLTQFRDRFYLTLRNDVRGYVTRGDDGLNFEPPRPWTFDDGSELGNYNTQQHWVTHSTGLFLVYTRRGANNDHVFRHRAPLFIARVDPERLCVVRESERVLVPQRGARMGNFGVADVGPEETWVVTTEWMQPVGVERHGSDNSVFVAKIRWEERNAK